MPAMMVSASVEFASRLVPFEHLLEELDVGNQDVFFGPEVVPKGAFQHPGLLGDGGRGDRSEPALVEEDQARFEQPVACFG